MSTRANNHDIFNELEQEFNKVSPIMPSTKQSEQSLKHYHKESSQTFKPNEFHKITKSEADLRDPSHVSKSSSRNADTISQKKSNEKSTVCSQDKTTKHLSSRAPASSYSNDFCIDLNLGAINQALPSKV